MTLQNILDLINQASSIQEFAKDNLLKIADSGDGRYILNYDEQGLDTPKGWIAHYCRGLTLAGQPNNYQIIAKAFNRFYNLGESPEYLNGGDQIDFTKPFEVQFKYDGSIILMYKWNNNIYINTRGSFAQGNVSQLYDGTWKDLFWSAKKTDLSNTFDFFPNVTYVYELCTPYNQVVDYYPTSFAKCLGAVYTDGSEIKNTFEGDTYLCNSLEEVLELLKTLKPTQEGFVIAQWNEDTKTYTRRKCKTESWCALAHLKDSTLQSDSKLWDVVFTGEIGEVVSVFPHLKEKLEERQDIYIQLQSEVIEAHNKYKDIENQKDFAISIKDIKYKGVLFELRKNGTDNLKNYLQEFIRKNYN